MVLYGRVLALSEVVSLRAASRDRASLYRTIQSNNLFIIHPLVKVIKIKTKYSTIGDL